MRGSSNAPKIVHSNKNLLDNWDFTNPVNQRGQTSYTVSGGDASRIYTVDRWALGNNSTKNKLVISNNKITCYLSSLYSRFYQLIPIENTLNSGKKITLSVITENVNADLNLSLEFYNSVGAEMYTYDSIPMTNSNAENIHINGKTYKLFKVTITLTSNTGHLYCNIINLNDTSSTYSVSLIAAKLELGEVSTLKNDVLGVSYAEELRKCQRYFVNVGKFRVAGDLKATNGFAVHPIWFPCEMREKPAIYKSETLASENVSVEVFDVQSKNSATLYVKNNAAYDVYYDGGIEYAMFSADL